MRHTDFYNQYKHLDDCTREELKAAIKAHGNEYVFIHTDEDDGEDESQTPDILRCHLVPFR